MRQENFAVMMEFLRARLHEDKTVAQALKPGKNQDVERLRDRVLADIEAKRRLMDWVEEYPQALKDTERRVSLHGLTRQVIAGVSQDLRTPVIYELVVAYADHPDFHPEWKPIEVGDQDEPGADEPSARSRAGNRVHQNR
ncbi:DUF6221 family protein [Kitasatospora sp. NPDC094019]|uniref:DUF6221 family protein n=1 Tax=Kitasatospora sp. NPDC094019 TaxID=3364091 RepID=UPI0038051B79